MTPKGLTVSLKPIMTTPFYPPNLTRWNNEPVLQAFTELNELTRYSVPSLFFAEPVVRWEQQATSSSSPAGTITWYGPAAYESMPAAFRPLPAWGAQYAALSDQLVGILQRLVQATPPGNKTLILESALVIPSMNAVLTDGHGQFVLCPWGAWEDGTTPVPFAQTPLGLLTRDFFPMPAQAQPESSSILSSQADASQQNAAPKARRLHPRQERASYTLPARNIPRWATVSLSFFVGIFFFWFAFWAGTLFLIRWVAGVHIEHPLSPMGLSLLWHFWSAGLHAAPNALSLLTEGGIH